LITGNPALYFSNLRKFKLSGLYKPSQKTIWKINPALFHWLPDNGFQLFRCCPAHVAQVYFAMLAAQLIALVFNKIMQFYNGLRFIGVWPDVKHLGYACPGVSPGHTKI